MRIEYLQQLRARLEGPMGRIVVHWVAHEDPTPPIPLIEARTWSVESACFLALPEPLLRSNKALAARRGQEDPTEGARHWSSYPWRGLAVCFFRRSKEALVRRCG